MKEHKKLIWVAVAVVLAIIIIPSISMIAEEVDAGEIVVIQDPVDGELHVYKEPGVVAQMFGRATHYKKSNQFWFLAAKNKEEQDNSISVKWNDGGQSFISGSVRYDMPNEDKQIIRLHSTFGSQEAIEHSLIKTNVEKAIYMTGPLMTSKESYAEKRNDLIFYIEDQASRGVYRTRQRDVKEPDPLTGEEKIITRVEIQMDSTKGGIPVRQEVSPITSYGVRLYNISINGINYDANVEKQIKTQQESIMSVQTAIANAKRAEQDAITAQKQGEADAAKAKWEQEVVKAKAVTLAEQELAVQDLNTKKAASYKQQQILEGEGDAAKKRLVMQANGALEQKLDAWVKAQQMWADAFKNYQGNLVPLYQSGGANPGRNAAQDFMEMLMMKTAKDLNLNLKND